MEAIKKAMLAMKNEKDAATDKADQLEQTYLEKKDEKEKVRVFKILVHNKLSR